MRWDLGLVILRACLATWLDNRPEIMAKAVQEWISAVGAKTAFIAPLVGEWLRRELRRPLRGRLDKLLDGDLGRKLCRPRLVRLAPSIAATPEGLHQLTPRLSKMLKLLRREPRKASEVQHGNDRLELEGQGRRRDELG